MTEVVFAFIAVCVFGGIVYLVALKTRKDKERQIEEQRKFLQIQKVANRGLSFGNEFTRKYHDFTLLDATYFIQDEERIIYDEQKTANQKMQDGAGDVDEIEKGIILYQNLIRKLERYLADPDRHFKKKFHDFLDDSTLTDPVDLAINHPQLGVVIVKVNRNNAKKYVDPKYGSKHFRMNSGRSLNRRYLVSSSNTFVHDGYYGYYDDFGVVDFAILYNLLCDNSSDIGHIEDVGFTGGYQGGASGGGGVTRPFFVDADSVQSANLETTGDEAIADPTAVATAAADSIQERNTDSVIAEPFAEENARVESAQEDPTKNRDEERSEERSEGRAEERAEERIEERVEEPPAVEDPAPASEEPSGSDNEPSGGNDET